MTLLISVFAAVISTVVWYTNPARKTLKLGVLCWLFWGASIMWGVDAIFEYIELGAAYFIPAAADMLNDTFLGLSEVAFGMTIWIVYVLFKDPLGVVKSSLFKKVDAK